MSFRINRPKNKSPPFVKKRKKEKDTTDGWDALKLICDKMQTARYTPNLMNHRSFLNENQICYLKLNEAGAAYSRN